MVTLLKRYWFEFEFPKPRISHYGCLPACGCGITAFDYEDALKIMRRFILRDGEIPVFKQVIENIDVSTIEDNNVRLNLGVPVWRGAWYPAHNLRLGAYTAEEY